MRKQWLAALLAAILLLSGTALADWTAPDANLYDYEDRYGEASEEYKTIQYGDESETIGKIKETLSLFGYFANRTSNTYYRSLQTAIQVLQTQLRIGSGDGREITPLIQAIIADVSNMERAISPAIDTSAYSWEESTTYTAYTYTRLMRGSVRTDTMVGFTGEIMLSAPDGKGYHYAVRMEDDPEKMIYVAYEPLPRTTVFQPGDIVSVFGVTQDEQTLSHEGMDEPALMVKADRIGYAAP